MFDGPIFWIAQALIFNSSKRDSDLFGNNIFQSSWMLVSKSMKNAAVERAYQPCIYWLPVNTQKHDQLCGSSSAPGSINGA